jgi:hypothetical protein
MLNAHEPSSLKLAQYPFLGQLEQATLYLLYKDKNKCLNPTHPLTRVDAEINSSLNPDTIV